MTLPITTTPIICPNCRTEVAASLLSCPACHRLMHGERLSELARTAREAEVAGDLTGAMTLWREALDLLPRQSQQYQTVAAKVETLGREIDRNPAAAREAAAKRQAAGEHHVKGKLATTAAGIGALAVLLWKFKFIAVFLLTKGKLLLLGLTKTSTLFSMFLSLGVYWTVWGWKFALGVVLSIYVHEMGHVAELTRRGFKATAPMFIPGIGAVVRLRQHPSNPHEDARIGLAGPIWGLGAAAVAAGVFYAGGPLIWAAIARVGAWINLFNLMPIWQLDGGRGWRALNRRQAWLVVATMAIMLLLTHEYLLLLLIIVAVLRTISMPEESAEGDVTATTQFIALIGLLSALSRLPVPVP